MPRGQLISELLDRLVEIPILDRTMSGRTGRDTVASDERRNSTSDPRGIRWKAKNPKAPAVKREAEEDWGR
jgi:hypothetical protein